MQYVTSGGVKTIFSVYSTIIIGGINGNNIRPLINGGSVHDANSFSFLSTFSFFDSQATL